MARPLTQVDAPDPERRCPLIIDDDDKDGEYDEDREHEPTLDIEIEAGVCYFNAIGSCVMSGDEVLPCGERGVCVKKGEREPWINAI